MAYHARPLPSRPLRPTAAPTDPTLRPAAPLAAGSATPPAAAPTPAAYPTSTAVPAPVPASVPAPAADARSWYRREPWLAWLLAAFLPLAAALVVAEEGQTLPAAWRLPALGLSGACLLVAVALLARHGAARLTAPPR